MSIRPGWLMILLRSVLLLVCCLAGLSAGESELLKSLTKIEYLLIFLFKSISFSSECFEPLLFGANLGLLCIPVGLSLSSLYNILLSLLIFIF